MLIEKLGVGYANDSLSGTYFLYNGKPARIREVTYDRVRVRVLDENEDSMVEHEVFSGWKVLKYPRLGYRRFSNGLWGNVTRAARSYARGLSPGNTFVETTAWLRSDVGVAWAENSLGINPYEFAEEGYGSETKVRQMMTAALAPEYDGAEVFAQLLKKKEKCFIPSARYLVEPMPFNEDMLGVYMAGTLVGRLDYDLNIYGPTKNINVIKNMVKRYAA